MEKDRVRAWEVKTNEMGVVMAIVNRDRLVNTITQLEGLQSERDEAIELLREGINSDCFIGEELIKKIETLLNKITL